MPRSSPSVCLVAAVTRDGGIGLRGELLVRIPDDLRRLKRLTMGAPIVLGRKTWQSIGRPLPGRRNIVVTRDPEWRAEGAEAAASLDSALSLAAGAPRIFVLGGADIYALALPVADALELTEIDAAPPADTFFPSWNRAEFRQTAREEHATSEGLRYTFASYARIDQGK
ncbi:MAG TPA: dihydrofolate reductase [Caldimonas sp.]|nr:dihydrofolate reductase [Caldimonas sp.]